MQSAAFTPFRPHLNSTVIKQLATRIKHDTCTIDDAALVFDQETANQTSQTSLFMNDQFRRAVIKSFFAARCRRLYAVIKVISAGPSGSTTQCSKRCVSKILSTIGSEYKKKHWEGRSRVLAELIILNARYIRLRDNNVLRALASVIHTVKCADIPTDTYAHLSHLSLKSKLASFIIQDLSPIGFRD